MQARIRSFYIEHAGEIYGYGPAVVLVAVGVLLGVGLGLGALLVAAGVAVDPPTSMIT
jgi:hypothetical protein